MGKRRTILTPGVDAEFSKAGVRAYWKQIVPQAKINYTTRSGKRASIDFSQAYLDKLIRDFNSKGDVTPFMLADKDNAHTMDPERFRGVIKELRLAAPGEKPGLYGKVVFPKAKMAKAVELSGGALPVSARIRESDEGPTLVHVLGTLDPQVTGMLPWQEAELSAYDDDNVLDLSNATYSKDQKMAKNKTKVPDINDVTEDDIKEMTDAEVEAFLAKYAPDFDSVDDEDDDDDDDLDNEDDDEDEDDEDDEDEDDDDESDSHSSRRGRRELAGAGAALSKREKRDIELANSVAASANARAQEAMKRAAAAEWREYKLSKLDSGVPPHLLDLAEPVLNRADDLEIDLSNYGEEDINVSDIVKAFIDAAEGTVDLANEQGHNGNFTPGGSNEDDPDKALLDSWESQFPSNKAVGEKK